MATYYNEIDPYAAAWLRNLIAAGYIAPGDIDERSIADVRPDDLRPYTQCHFFAGIGVWSYALRRAGWPDDLPVWTGSCPCQPFSAAGRGEGFADERHLWPAFHHLIAQHRPPVVFGEQVASKAVDPWIDLVQDDMEGLGYAFGAVPFPSAGVGAPHIRDRAYFMAYAPLHNSRSGPRPCIAADDGWWSVDRGCGATDIVANPEHCGREAGQPEWRGAGATLPSIPSSLLADAEGGEQRRLRERGTGNRRSELPDRGHGSTGIVADTTIGGWGEECPNAAGRALGNRTEGLPAGSFAGGGNQRPGPTNGFWGDSDWLHCRDGRWRPVEPGTFPLAHGAPARVGRLRAYGNAINAEAAAAFISASVDVLEDRGHLRLTPMSVLTTARGGIFD